MKKNIILIVMFVVLVCSLVTNCLQHKTIIEEHKTINNFKAYYNAAEDLLNSINNDIGIEDTYMCGDIGANYYIAVSKLNSNNDIDCETSKNK